MARRDWPGLAVIDRFDQRELDGVALPGEASTIRLDPFGRWLLARPAAGDSVWIVDLPAKRLAGSLPTTWQVDLPAVGADGSVLLRQGDDVVAFRVDTAGKVREAGRVICVTCLTVPKVWRGAAEMSRLFEIHNRCEPDGCGMSTCRSSARPRISRAWPASTNRGFLWPFAS